MNILHNEYGMLDHPDDSCHYNPHNLDNKAYIIESYGQREDLKGVDGFYSKEIDYTGR